MIVLSIPWESVYKVSCGWVDILIFYILLFELCIWPDVISQRIQQRNRDDAAFVSRVITGDESWIYGYDSEIKQKSKLTEHKVRSMSSFSLTSRGLFKKINLGRPNSQFLILL
jgi:hypothetical protein